MAIARENLEHYELLDDQDGVHIEHLDILKEFGEADSDQLADSPYANYFDTIVMNPPFGTKNNEGVDTKLLRAATRALKPGGCLFSLHKASTQKYVVRFGSEECGADCTAEAIELIAFDLPKTYGH